jgi:hypothetical protein
MTEAESFDLDGIVIHSPLPFPIDEVSKYFRVRPVNYESPPIVPLSREVDETYAMSAKQHIAYGVQSVRSVDLDTWEFLWNRTADVYGNTGRPNKRPWVDMTARTLEKGFVYTRFKNIFFRPAGVTGIESKGAAIAELVKQYDNVTHIDDDPWVIFGLAKVFPRVTFMLVQDLDFGILVSRAEMERFPNVRRVAQLRHLES